MSSTASYVLTLSSFNLLFFTQVLTVLSITIKYNEYATDKGGNVSIPCIAQGNIMWIKEHGSNSTIIQTGRVLVLRNVSTADGGIYVCFATLPRAAATTTTTTAATIITTVIAATTSAQQEQQLEQPEQVLQQPELSEGTTAANQAEEQELAYQAVQRVKLTVRTTPGPVTQLYFKASTILGFLIWRFNKTQSGGYPVRSFTAEFRNVSYRTPPANASYEHAWIRMDPINIAPNVRQMEVYRLAPNTTYEFRIWANNELGSGEVVTTNVTTLPETKEEELQDGWDNIELIPNIILNPGFSESDDPKIEPTTQAAFSRTIIFSHTGQQQFANQNRNLNLSHGHTMRNDDDYDDDEDEDTDVEPTMEKFKRKVSVFFTGPTIKRI
ncbi:uncharacterized protein LOC108607263 isoform X2 [Drosophila busckii]|uniref:uncharacterized protein LOC108607263 isoform X2 n=1 Tax=Drosophila busckii TaxID=30019 RepID=UPI00083F1ED9|nr:uncharacterized protein LOC108607263 isoform X2 [Drosophila busckii]